MALGEGRGQRSEAIPMLIGITTHRNSDTKRQFLPEEAYMAERDAVSMATIAAIPTMESASKQGINVKRFFAKPGIHPFDEIEWELRTASIQNEKGLVIFEQRNVEVPSDWSQTATNIVASKYFHGKLGTPERESRDRKSTRLNSSHRLLSRMPSSA